jgi:hypothetical protein
VQFLNIVSAKLLDDPACAQFFFDDIPEKDKEKVCCVTIASLEKYTAKTADGMSAISWADCAQGRLQ